MIEYQMQKGGYLMTKKIVMISNDIAPMVGFREHTFNYLVKQGYEVFLIGDFKGKRYFDRGRLKYIDIKTSRKGTNPITDLIYQRKIRKTLKHIEPDLVFTYTIKPNVYATKVCKKLKIKNVAVITGLGYAFNNKGLKAAIARYMYKINSRHADRFFFLNSANLERFVNSKISTKDNSYIMNGEGIDTEKFYLTAMEDKTEFIMVARLLFDKGIVEYLEAARAIKRLYPDVIFKLAGSFDKGNPTVLPKEDLDKFIEDNTINYLGYCDNIIEHVSSSTCVVLPSYHEGLSVSLLEGCSLGKPIIASNIPGCKELINNSENGFLCEPKSTSSLIECLEKFHHLSYENKKKFGMNSRKLVEQKFSSDSINYFYTKQINEILDNT